MSLSRAAWSGYINFGPVSIRAKLYQARENHTPGLNMVHTVDGGRVRFQKVCECCETVLRDDEIGRGVPRSDKSGLLNVIDQHDLDEINMTSRTAEVVDFTYLGNIPSSYFDALYYIDAHNGADRRGQRMVVNKAYAVFRDALYRTGQAAIVRIAIRQREQLAVIWPEKEHLVMRTLYWADELREPDFPDAKLPVDTTEDEVTMAAQLIDAMTKADIDLTSYRDNYADKLRALVDAAKDAPEPAPAEDTSVDPLLAALQKAVADRSKAKAS